MIVGDKMYVELRGAPMKLRQEIRRYQGPKTVREYAVVGPGGTGKSMGIGEVLLWLGLRYPGIRILVLRKTRKSLTQSFVTTWEAKILPAGDPILAGAAKANRSSYLIRPDGWEGRPTEMVLGGLDEPANLFSTDYDVVYIQQAEQIDLPTWSKFRRALRNFGHPELRILPLIADINPAEPTHWLKNRIDRGQTTQLVSRHKDNPAWWDEDNKRWTEEGAAYIASLQSMPEGPDKDRLYYGLWSARAGIVWRYDSSVHEIERPDNLKTLGIKWYCGSMDWGTQHPGVFQVWGVDGDNNAYRVAEWFHTHKSLDWWADRVVDSYKEFQPLRAIIADPSRPDAIEHMNRRLGEYTGGSYPHLVRAADNTKTRSGVGDLSGLDLVRVRLAEKRIKFVKGSLRCRDESLAEAGLPFCAEMEFPQYTYELDDEGRPIGEMTDKDCSDHAMDTTRYSQTYIWGRDLSQPVIKPRFEPGSLGALLRHDRVAMRT